MKITSHKRQKVGKIKTFDPQKIPFKIESRPHAEREIVTRHIHRI